MVLTCVDNSSGQLLTEVDVATDACPRLIVDRVVADPAIAFVSEHIQLSAAARDLDDSAAAITFAWTIGNEGLGNVGVLLSPSARDTVLRCEGVGSAEVRVTASNPQCSKSLSVRTSCIKAGCGDGVIDPLTGEHCDPGARPGLSAGDRNCPPTCAKVCGDGFVTLPETCDTLGNLGPGSVPLPAGQTCPNGCSGALIICGDGVATTLASLPDGASATGMAWAPDGSQRLFVLTKAGAVRIIKSGALLATPFSSDAVFTNSECGLLGIAFDPSFRQNGYVYLFMTVSATQQQIVRYTASGDVGATRTVILAGLPSVGNNHDGGGIGFGPDGKLYWAIGDLGNGTGVNSDLTSLAAKVGRANRDGSLPAGNPFADGAGPNQDYIWARGLRNPFTLAFEPGSGALWVDVAGTGFEQIFVISAGVHAGYNLYENNQPAGFLTPAVAYRTNGISSRSLAAASGAVRSAGVVTYTTTVAHGFRRGGKITVTGVSDTSFDTVGYVQSTPTATTFTFTQAGPNAASGGGTAASENMGGAITGGDFWSSSAVPAAYRGNYFFGDFNSGRLHRVTLAADGAVASVDRFATLSSLVDVAPGPDGALYTVGFAGSVTRIAYNATAQGIVATPLKLRLDENGSAVVNVRLATAPAGNVSVAASVSGDASVSVGGTALSFNAANWSVPQTVVLEAAQDSDALDDLATLTLSSSSLTSIDLEAKVTDNFAGTAAAAVPATGRHIGFLSVALIASALLGLRRRRSDLPLTCHAR